MRTTVFSLFLLASILGCQNQSKTGNQGTAQSQTATSEMTGRLEAALEMEAGTARHNALVQVAEKAAEKGDVEIVLQAIKALDDGTARDNLCANCARLFAEQGETSKATAVAKEMTNETQRSNVLAGIATGNEAD